MNENLEKVLTQINRANIEPEQAPAPRRSLESRKTWLELLDTIKNIRYSTQTIFKVSGKHLIHTDYNIEPIFLYDNIILGKSGDRLAFLFGRTFEYVRNQLLSESINKESYNLAKSVFGTCIAGYIIEKRPERHPSEGVDRQPEVFRK